MRVPKISVNWNNMNIDLQFRKIEKYKSLSDKQFAASFDENARLTAQLDSDARMALGDIMDSEYVTSGEHAVVSFAYTLGYGEVMENPYATYQNTTAE